MDQKSIFDAGYRSYEDGRGESEVRLVAVEVANEPRFTATWRAGWQRAQEDSILSRPGYARR